MSESTKQRYDLVPGQQDLKKKYGSEADPQRKQNGETLCNNDNQITEVKQERITMDNRTQIVVCIIFIASSQA